MAVGMHDLSVSGPEIIEWGQGSKQLLVFQWIQTISSQLKKEDLVWDLIDLYF